MLAPFTSHNSFNTTPAFAHMQDLAYMEDQNAPVNGANKNSRLYETDSGEIYLRQKTLAEVVGEKILRPTLDTIHSCFSKLPALGNWAWNIPPFSLPVAAATSTSQEEVINELILAQQSKIKSLIQLPKVENPLHMAVITGDIDLASSLLEKGADVNEEGLKGNTPLELAFILLRAKEGDNTDAKDMFKLLLSQGADINAKIGNIACPLTWSIVDGNPEMVAFLLQHGADPNTYDGTGETPFNRAFIASNEIPPHTDNSKAILKLLEDHIEAQSPAYHFFKNHPFFGLGCVFLIYKFKLYIPMMNLAGRLTKISLDS